MFSDRHLEEAINFQATASLRDSPQRNTRRQEGPAERGSQLRIGISARAVISWRRWVDCSTTGGSWSPSGTSPSAEAREPYYAMLEQPATGARLKPVGLQRSSARNRQASRACHLSRAAHRQSAGDLWGPSLNSPLKQSPFNNLHYVRRERPRLRGLTQRGLPASQTRRFIVSGSASGQSGSLAPRTKLVDGI